jgi:hypothetical protein
LEILSNGCIMKLFDDIANNQAADPSRIDLASASTRFHSAVDFLDIHGPGMGGNHLLPSARADRSVRKAQCRLTRAERVDSTRPT